MTAVSPSLSAWDAELVPLIAGPRPTPPKETFTLVLTGTSPAKALERIARIAEMAGGPAEWWGPRVAREVDEAEELLEVLGRK